MERHHKSPDLKTQGFFLPVINSAQTEGDTMADTISFKLKGTAELSRIFKTLPQEIQREVVVPAAMEAMRIVLASAKARAANVDDKATANYIPKNITIFEDKRFFEETGATKVSVGVKRGKGKRDGGNTYYWWWVELGHHGVRAQPFMRNAMSQNTEAVFSEFISKAKLQLVKLGLT